MRILSRHLDKGVGGGGSFKLMCEEDDDLFHLYQLLSLGDILTASTSRKTSTVSSTGSVSVAKIRLTLSLKIVDIQYEPVNATVRVKGINTRENDAVKLGAHHTIDIHLNESFSLEKEAWDALDMQRIDECCNASKKAEVAALMMQPGLANLCLITHSLTLLKAKIEMNIPKKRGAHSMNAHDASLARFFTLCLEALLKHVDFTVIKTVIVASPGFLKDDFATWMWSECQRLNHRAFLEHKSNFLFVHASSGHKHALNEALQNPAISHKLMECKSVQEVKLMEQFQMLLMNEPEKAYYGEAHVRYAHTQRAIAYLLVTDQFMRGFVSSTHNNQTTGPSNSSSSAYNISASSSSSSSNSAYQQSLLDTSNYVQRRKSLIELCEAVTQSGNHVAIYSTQHVSGEQLAQLSGIAAILRFPISEEQVEQAMEEQARERAQQQNRAAQSASYNDSSNMPPEAEEDDDGDTNNRDEQLDASFKNVDLHDVM